MDNKTVTMANEYKPQESIDWHQQLIELAKNEQRVNVELSQLEAERDALLELHIMQLDKKITQLNADKTKKRNEFKKRVIEYHSDTGDVDPHNLIKVKQVRKVKYTDSTAIVWLKDNADEYLKLSIDKRKLNKSLLASDDNLATLPHEIVVEPTVQLSAFDHLAQEPVDKAV